MPLATSLPLQSKFWNAWFCTALVQTTILTYALTKLVPSADLPEACKYVAGVWLLPLAVMLKIPNFDTAQRKLNAVVLAVIAGLQLSGAGIIPGGGGAAVE